MIAAATGLPSKNQLKAAGDRIRKRVTGDLELDGEKAAEDTLLVKRWRSAHSTALTTTRVGLGGVVGRVLGINSQAGLVTQRLKRYESIVAKLVRDKPRLGEIEDIAGCRAVLPSLAEVYEVHKALTGAHKLDIESVRDYNVRPHPGGYRALHLWCRRDGFKVEVQLRTRRQQKWAQNVERWDSAMGYDIKHETAPEPALTFFREVAHVYYQFDTDVANSDVDMSGLDAAAQALEAWVEREVGP